MRYWKIILVIFLFAHQALAQDEGTEETISSNAGIDGVQGFHVGFFAGAFFPAKYSASLYDGYGVDASGNKNSFLNSVLVQRMASYGMDSVNCPGVQSQYQNTDQIAQALGVDHDQWRFIDAT